MRIDDVARVFPAFLILFSLCLRLSQNMCRYLAGVARIAYGEIERERVHFSADYNGATYWFYCRDSLSLCLSLTLYLFLGNQHKRAAGKLRRRP